MREELYFGPEGLITGVDNDDSRCVRTSYIPMRHCRIIWERLINGSAFVTCSPLYVITRQQAAFILANWETEL